MKTVILRNKVLSKIMTEDRTDDEGKNFKSIDKLAEEEVDGSAIGDVDDDFLKDNFGIAKKPHRVLFLNFVKKNKG